MESPALAELCLRTREDVYEVRVSMQPARHPSLGLFGKKTHLNEITAS